MSKRFLCSYHHNGAQWSLVLDAEDWPDAEARVKKLGYLHLDGELMATIPANRVTGLWVRFSCWLKNHFNRL